MYNYSKEHNILFVHIPKNAGSSIRDKLDITKSGHYPLSILQSHMDKKTFDNAIKIAVFRNPWERMVSWYRYRKQKSQDPKQMPFSYWLRNGKVQYNMQSFDSLSQIKWCCKLDSIKLQESLDYIFNFEHLDEQWKEFTEFAKSKSLELEDIYYLMNRKNRDAEIADTTRQQIQDKMKAVQEQPSTLATQGSVAVEKSQDDSVFDTILGSGNELEKAFSI